MKFSNTNLNLYRTFITVYEIRNMQSASDLLGITRQAVAKNITELSKQLNIKLFNGTNKGVLPTGEASALYRKIQPAMEMILRAEESIVDFNEQSSGLIKIATTTNFSGSYLNSKIGFFREMYPNVKFDVSFQPVQKALESLESGLVHLVISAVPLVSEKEFRFKKVELENFEQSFITTKKFAETHNISNYITNSQLSKLPFLAIRTIKHFVDNVREPDIISDSQDIAYDLMKTNSFVTFGMWDAAKKDLGDNVFKLDIEGVTVRNLSLVCAFPSTESLAQIANTFIKFLTDRSEHSDLA